jgi:hypothetical protein
VGFAVWARRSVILFLGAVAGGVFWVQVVVAWTLDPARSLEPSADHGVLTAGAFLLLDVLGRSFATRPEPRLQAYGISLRLWVLRFALVSALVLSFAGPWEELLDAEWRAPGLVTGWGILVAVVTLGAAFARARGRVESSAAVLREAGSGVAFLAFAAVARGVAAATQTEEAAVVLQVLTNLFAAGTGVWLVYRGIRDTITHYYYLGIATLIAIALCRYFDLIGDYIGGAVLFAACAGILFGAARYWRRQVGVEREVDGEAKPV